MVAHLRDEDDAAIRLHTLAAAAIRCHHPNPVRAHSLRLPVHPDLHPTLAPWVGIAHHRGHLRLGNGQFHIRGRQSVHHSGNGLEMVEIVAVLPHGMCNLGDEESAQTLGRNRAQPL